MAFDHAAYAASARTCRLVGTEKIKLLGRYKATLEHQKVDIPGKWINGATDNWSVMIAGLPLPGFGKTQEVIGQGPTREEAIKKATEELARRKK